MDGQTSRRGTIRGSSVLQPAGSRHSRRSDGERSYRAIMEAATRLATERGLDGLSISELAAATGMSKGGLYAHFGSKQELQLATVAAAADIMDTQVIEPALRLPEPIARLRAVCENFLTYAQHMFLGGCFFASVSSEFDTRPGLVRDSIAEQHVTWVGLLTELIGDAREAGQLDLHGKDPAQLAFELESLLHLANDSHVLHRDTGPFHKARIGIEWLLDQHAPA